MTFLFCNREIMPLFRSKSKPYSNYSDQLEIPTDIPKYGATNDDPVYLPKFIVRVTQEIFSFAVRKSSNLPFIGTKDGHIREFQLDEFHIIIFSLLALSIHKLRKYQHESRRLQAQLNTLLMDSKMLTFETLANVDEKSIKRIECLYYKNQFQLYDVDLLTRTELRSFIQQVMSQCDVLSSLSLKILEALNNMFRSARKVENQRMFQQKLKQCRNSGQQQRLKTEWTAMTERIDDFYDDEMDKLDAFTAFFDDKNNEQHLIELRDQQRNDTMKEILEAFKSQNEQKKIDIDAAKKQNGDGYPGTNERKDTEEDDEMAEGQTRRDKAKKLLNPLQQRRKLLELEMNYDHSYLVEQAQNLPIQQIDFSAKEVSMYNLRKEVDQMKYDMAVQQGMERRSERIRKYGTIAFVTAVTGFTYWSQRHYTGKTITERIRDGKASFWSYF